MCTVLETGHGPQRGSPEVLSTPTAYISPHPIAAARASRPGPSPQEPGTTNGISSRLTATAPLQEPAVSPQFRDESAPPPMDYSANVSRAIAPKQASKPKISLSRSGSGKCKSILPLFGVNPADSREMLGVLVINALHHAISLAYVLGCIQMARYASRTGSQPQLPVEVMAP